MKKSMWIGSAGALGPLAVGYDGSELHVVTGDDAFKQSILKIYNNENNVQRRANEPDFDFPDYIGTSSMYFLGVSSDWDEDIFNTTQPLLDYMRKKK